MSRKPSTTKVYVGNLGERGEKNELELEFERFGKLYDVWVARSPPGFAFVEFFDQSAAEEAVKELDGRRICGQRVRVELSHGRGKPGRRPPPRRDDRDHYDDRYDDRLRRSPPRRMSPRRGRSPSGDGWRGRSRSRSPRRYRN